MLASVLVAGCLAPAGGARADSQSSGEIELEDWFNEETGRDVPQVREGELVFLSPPPENKTLHSINTITVTRTSLDDGWVQLRQCYEGLDAVPAAEVDYQYKKLRRLRIDSKTNIGQVASREQTVQLTDVQHGATLCIRAEAQILYPQADGRFLLRNGPFHRRFLDGYFPLHVSMDVQFPSTLLHYIDVSPEAQSGFEVDVKDEHVYIDSWFAGMLSIEVHFSER
ncbi:MAG: hypothetical protein U9P00_05220 [Pseudomonadota bacterium]|nr:hypothetical protein [Pseudomonadota bacterium]